MFLTTLDFFGETHTPVVVDSSGIDVSEFEQEEDKKFLVEKGTELLRIDAKAEDAKAKIVKAIDDRAEDAKGKIVYQIQEEFRNDPEKKGGLLRYFHSLGYWGATDMEKMGLEKPTEIKASMVTVFTWANGYRGAKEMADQLAESYTEEQIREKITAQSPTALAKIYTRFSTEDRKKLYENTTPLDVKSVIEESQKPERKLNKAIEDLDEAKEIADSRKDEWEKAKKSPSFKTKESKAKELGALSINADKAVSKLETKIKDLEEQIKARAKEEEETNKTLDKLQNEVDRLNAPEEEKKQRRTATANALIATLPNVHSHLVRFYGDIQDHEPDTVLVLEEHIKLLQSLIEAHL